MIQAVPSQANPSASADARAQATRHMQGAPKLVLQQSETSAKWRTRGWLLPNAVCTASKHTRISTMMDTLTHRRPHCSSTSGVAQDDAMAVPVEQRTYCVDAVAVSPRSSRRSGYTRSGLEPEPCGHRIVGRVAHDRSPNVMQALHSAWNYIVRAIQRPCQNDGLENRTWKTRLSSPGSRSNHESTACAGCNPEANDGTLS